MICNSPLWGMDSLIRSRVLAVADETKSPVESGVCTLDRCMELGARRRPLRYTLCRILLV